jgi:hypothetical protein
MKTKNLFRFGCLMIAAATFSVTGCKKDNSTTATTADTASMQQLTQDEANVENASDLALNDADNVLSAGQLKSTENDPCNTTKTISGVQNDTITITINYHGLTCNGTHSRTGDIIIKKKYQENWGQQGATVIVNLVNFKITKVSNGKWIELNGIKHFENVSGHYLFQLGDSGVTSIVHREWGAVTTTFDDNNHTTKIWNLDRQRTFTGTPGALVLTVDGLGSADGKSSLVSWGLNRNNEQFYTSIIEPVVHRQVCDFDPCSGKMIHEIPVVPKSATTTFGYDSNNNPITNGDCPTRYKVDWIVGSKSGTFFLPL